MIVTPKRVFILGLQRSGTTWLANMLAGLPNVAAIEAEDHRGVHESIFFSHFARAFGDWHDLPARQRFLDAFKLSDYFLLSGLEPELLDEFSHTKDNYGQVFISFMDLVAAVEGADAWVEKSPHHVFCVDQIMAVAPDARFVLVERRLPDLVASRLHGFGRKLRWPPLRWLDVARGTLAAKHVQRELRLLARQDNALLVRYEDLVADTDMAVRQSILDHIGVDADPADMISAYAPNSSFVNDTKPRRLGPVSRLVVTVTGAIGAVIPLAVLRRWRESRRAERGMDWPDWTWKRSKFDPAKAQTTQREIILD
jgi:hypothetical protein